MRQPSTNENNAGGKLNSRHGFRAKTALSSNKLVSLSFNLVEARRFNEFGHAETACALHYCSKIVLVMGVEEGGAGLFVNERVVCRPCNRCSTQETNRAGS